MENTILILIKIITALYYNDKTEDKSPQLYEELQEVIASVKTDQKSSGGIGTEDSVIEALRYTAEWMLYNKEGNYTFEDINQRLSINFQGNSEYIEIIKTTLQTEVEPNDARKRVLGILQELKYNKARTKLRTAISKANAKLNFSGEYVNQNLFVNELMGELESMLSSESGEVDGLVGRIDFTDEESIEAALNKGIALTNEEGILNTGFHGFNEAGGGGIKRGQYVNFGALTHHYKSGMLLDLSLNLPVYNDPWMWDNTKKPMILRLSFENTVDQDIIILYKRLYEITFNKKYDSTNVLIDKAKRLLKDYFQQKGYTFQIEHYDPNTFGIYDLFYILNRYIEAGYEIHAVICDYPGLFAHNTTGDRFDAKLQKTVEMIRNFCYPKGIAFCAAHQLSTEALALARENALSFTRKVCTGGWYMDCKSLNTKFDLEYVMHIYKHSDGRKYLMVSKGKHRLGESIPESKCHFIYAFDEVGGIPVDANGESRALYSLPKSLDADPGNVWND